MIYYVKNNFIRIFGSKIFSLLLLAFCSVSIVVNLHWIVPSLKIAQEKKATLIALSLAKEETMSSEALLNILVNFAKEKNDQLWIHKMTLKDNDFDLVIRSLNNNAVEQYVHNVSKKNSLLLESMVVKSMNVEKQDEAEEEAPVPFAVKLYLESIKESEQKENEDKNQKLLFSYEANIKLRTKSN